MIDIVRSSRVISVITLISRITGLIRDVLIAWWLGNSWIQDRLAYAFAIPHLFRRLFGEGALSAAFIPVFTGKLSKENKEAAWKLLNNIATVLAFILISITGVLFAIIVIFWWISDKTIQTNLTLSLTGMMVPYMIFVCLVALFSAVLNCFGRFGLPAFMPIILNIFQIVGVIIANLFLSRFGVPKYKQVYIIGFAVLLAGLTQIVVIILSCKRLGFTLKPDFSIKNPELRHITKLMLPMIAGLGVMQFAGWLDNQIILSLTATTDPVFRIFGYSVSYPLREGALSAVTFARRLYNLPLGVLGIAIATAAFPAFSRHSAEGNYQLLREDITKAFNLAIFQGLPAGIGLIILAEPIVRVIFEHGAFTEYHTQETALVLRFYAIGMWAYFAQHIILRGFYSLNDTITPLKVMCFTLIINIAMNLTLLWIPSLRQGVFGLSTAVMIMVNVVILGKMLADKIGGINLKPIFICFTKTIFACLIMSVFVLWSKKLPIDNRYVGLAIYLLVGIVTFGASSYILRIKEFGQITKIIK